MTNLTTSVYPWMRSSIYDFLEQITVTQHKMANSYSKFICCCYWMRSIVGKNWVRRYEAPLLGLSVFICKMEITLLASFTKEIAERIKRDNVYERKLFVHSKSGIHTYTTVVITQSWAYWQEQLISSLWPTQKPS